MSRNSDIRNELNELNSPLADISNKMPLQVPAGYFELLPGDIMDLTGEESFLSIPRQPLPFAVNEGYFNNLSSDVLATVKQENKQKAPGRRVHFHSLRSFKLAVAAVLAAMILTGSYLTFTNVRSSHPAQLLAGVERNDITRYMNAYGVTPVSIDQHFSELPVENADIVEYLNETGWD